MHVYVLAKRPRRSVPACEDHDDLLAASVCVDDVKAAAGALEVELLEWRVSCRINGVDSSFHAYGRWCSYNIERLLVEGV